MTTKLEIQSIEIKNNDSCKKTTYTVLKTVYDSNKIEQISDRARRKYWHLEGECGAEYEVKGSLLNEVLVTKEYNKDDFYRCSLYY